MNRVVTTAAAAAAYALLSTLSVRDARAQLVYDSFPYPAASALQNQVNPINGQAWATMSGNDADDDIVLSAGSLSYPGLSAPLGNSAGFGEVGKSARLGFDRTARAGTMYYSLALRVGSLGSMTTSPTFIAGFSDRTGDSALQPTTIGARLYLRRGASSTPGAETFNLGVSKNSSFDITFDTAEYAVNTALFVVGSYEIVGQGSGTDDIARLYINPTSLGAASAPAAATTSSPIITAPVDGTDLTIGGVPSLAAFVLRQGNSAQTAVPDVQIDELRVDSAWARVTPPTGVSWNVDGGGAWSDGAKWSTLASPDAPGAYVNLNQNISAPRTIDVDVPVALRTINFNSSQPYALSAGGGGSGSLNFSASAGINVFGGSHTIAAPVTLGGEMLVSVATGAALNLTGNFTGGSNAIIKAGDGAMTMKLLRGGSADVVAGSIAIAPNGGPAGTSRVTSLALGPEASIDLSNNDLVVDYTGSTNSPIGAADSTGAYSGLSGMIASASNFTAWNGPGIRTSQPNARLGLTTLGIGEASAVLGLRVTDTAVWSGQSIDGTSVLIRYTYAGDANLDGQIDAGDYGIIDNFVQMPAPAATPKATSITTGSSTRGITASSTTTSRRRACRSATRCPPAPWSPPASPPCPSPRPSPPP